MIELNIDQPFLNRYIKKKILNSNQQQNEK
jgi:hypothetical protein